MKWCLLVRNSKRKRITERLAFSWLLIPSHNCGLTFVICRNNRKKILKVTAEEFSKITSEIPVARFLSEGSSVFEIVNQFCVRENLSPNFDKITKIESLTSLKLTLTTKSQANKLAFCIYKILQTNILVSICYYHSFTLMNSFIL